MQVFTKESWPSSNSSMPRVVVSLLSHIEFIATFGDKITRSTGFPGFVFWWVACCVFGFVFWCVCCRVVFLLLVLKKS